MLLPFPTVDDICYSFVVCFVLWVFLFWFGFFGMSGRELQLVLRMHGVFAFGCVTVNFQTVV